MGSMQGVVTRQSDDELSVDPYVAVDRALNPMERETFASRQLHGRMHGANPGDWLDQADDADAFLEVIEPWWEQHGADTISAVVLRSELPQRLAHRLVSSALLACIGMGIVDTHTPAQSYVYALAERASLWARGYAERDGWSPADPEPEPHIK